MGTISNILLNAEMSASRAHGSKLEAASQHLMVYFRSDGFRL
jgi:hypothetical protein